MPPFTRRSIPLAQPHLTDLERRYVQDVLTSSRLALGPYLEAFEARMAAACDARHAIAVSSGTSALHAIVRALGLGPGDEVITTPFSFVASSNALLYEGVTPRFVDIDPHTYNIDVDRIAAAITPATRAILAVDVFGQPADWPALTSLAEEHGLALIDDACEAPGATIGGRPVGSWGDAAAFGFYPNKQITTGEGGCITTNSDEVAALCRSLRNQGRASDGRMRHVRLGYNYRMSELSAALGLAQLERLDELLSRREQVASWYEEALDGVRGDVVLPPHDGGESAHRSWFVYVVQLREPYDTDDRAAFMQHLERAGIGCAPYLPAIHLQPYYRQRFGYRRGDYPICEHVADRTIALPFFVGLSRDQVRHVARSVREGLESLRPTPSVGLHR